MTVQTVRVTYAHAPPHILQHSPTGGSATLLLHFTSLIAQVLHNMRSCGSHMCTLSSQLSVTNAASAQDHEGVPAEQREEEEDFLQQRVMI